MGRYVTFCSKCPNAHFVTNRSTRARLNFSGTRPTATHSLLWLFQVTGGTAVQSIEVHGVPVLEDILEDATLDRNRSLFAEDDGRGIAHAGEGELRGVLGRRRRARQDIDVPFLILELQ